MPVEVNSFEDAVRALEDRVASSIADAVIFLRDEAEDLSNSQVQQAMSASNKYLESKPNDRMTGSILDMLTEIVASVDPASLNLREVIRNVQLLEDLKSVLSAKYLKKLQAYESVLYSSNLAEDLYLSFLEDSADKPHTQPILEAIFTTGLLKRRDLSDNFIETVRSFHRNGFGSSHLATLVQHLQTLGIDMDTREEVPFGLEFDLQDKADHLDDDEFMRRLKQADDSQELL